jgi:hypothetical protein
MSEQLQRKRPVGTGSTGTDEQVPVPVDVGSTDAMQRALKDAADALKRKKVMDDALKAAQEADRVRKKRRPPCCCC